MLHRLITFLAIAACCCSALSQTVDDYASKIAPLIEPAKLATLGARGANQRVQKATYWLAMAKSAKLKVSSVAGVAVEQAGYTNRLARDLTKSALLRNLSIAEKLGSLNSDGLVEMRKGNAATVRKGPYAGDQLSVDHIIPSSVVPELDNVIANLELMPSKLNAKKNAKIGQRQQALARTFFEAKLLSADGLRRVSARPR